MKLAEMNGKAEHVTPSSFDPSFRCDLTAFTIFEQGYPIILFRMRVGCLLQADNAPVRRSVNLAVLMPELPFTVIPFPCQARSGHYGIIRNEERLPERFRSVTGPPWNGIATRFGVVDLALLNRHPVQPALRWEEVLAVFPERDEAGPLSRQILLGSRFFDESWARLHLPFDELLFESVRDTATGRTRRVLRADQPCGEMYFR